MMELIEYDIVGKIVVWSIVAPATLAVLVIVWMWLFDKILQCLNIHRAFLAYITKGIDTRGWYTIWMHRLIHGYRRCRRCGRYTRNRINRLCMECREEMQFHNVND